MTLADLLSTERLRQEQFPVVRDQAFLAHAAVCPMPGRVVQAIRDYLEPACTHDQEMVLPIGRFHQTREAAAKLLHAQPEEIAFVGPTSLALSYVASGLKFRRHENILVYYDDYPSNVYPWMALAEQGVEVRLLNVRELGRIRAIDVQGQVDEQTRLVALASCHFISGWRIALGEIGRWLRQRGILFCVDGIQTLGAFPTTVEHVDFMAADAHKWLLGPCGAGLLYVRRELQEKLQPPIYGWHNVRCPDYVAQPELSLRNGARRYEPGTANLLGLVGLQAAIELLLEIGIDAIAAELLRKRSWLVNSLKNKGYTVLEGNASPEHASAIISFHKPDADLATLHQQLAAEQIITSLRTARSGQKFIRLSPHFYNTDEELGRLLEKL